MLSSGGEPRFSKAARRRYWQPQLTVTTPVARLSVLSTTVACGSDPAQWCQRNSTRQGVLTEADRRMAGPPSPTLWAPCPLTRHSRFTLGWQPIVNCCTAWVPNPFCTDSMDALGWQPNAICCAVPLRPDRKAPSGHPSDGHLWTCVKHHTPWTLGQWSLRTEPCQQASQRSATATCNAGKQ